MSVPARLSDRCYDVAIYGAGYAGVAAAEALIARGLAVALIDRRPTALWESAWAFSMRVGSGASPEWQALLAELTAHAALPGGIPDGACTEALIIERLRRSAIDLAWYRTPVAIEQSEGLVTALVLGGKGGLSRVRAQRWIDASEHGELAGLCAAQWYAPVPISQETVLHLRRAAWDGTSERELAAGVRWERGGWENEWRLVLSGSAAGDVRQALAALRAEEPLASEALVSHASVVPFPVHARHPLPSAALPANLLSAIPAWSSGCANDLAGRFALGLGAAQRCQDAPGAAPTPISAAPLAEHILAGHQACTVAVAGAGTGGAMAALAAARSGARTCIIEPLPFVGGIGVGGGIHYYYFGVKGGLQEELDQRTRNLMPLFAPSKQIQGFHPQAKKLALEELLADAGVERLQESTLVAVERSGRRVISALVATPRGPLRLQGRVWIDGTGDGDLCARAGARSSFGRQGDGLPHAYTQSSGRAGLRDGRAFMEVVNFDAGWVDPRDDDDLTRARAEGIAHYVLPLYDALNRPTYLAPAIGLRQARQVVTDRTITLDDLIVRRRFADGVGLTGCHYDNHAVDYEFESDEGLFWTWGCRAWSTGRTGGEIPLGALIPADLDNVVIASRALGVSQDAHHSLRMQRDMQRIGEVAGLLGALAAEGQVRAVPFAHLRRQLVASGALAEEGDENPSGFGERLERPAARAIVAGTVPEWLAALRQPDCCVAMWQLAKAGGEVGDTLAALLTDSDPQVTWRAALVLALRGDARAEPRLLAAITTREDGFEHLPANQRPSQFNRVVCNWWTAVAMLRCCATAACLPVLAALSLENLPFHCATALALTCTRLAARLPDQRPVLAVIAGNLADHPPLQGVRGDPQRNPTTYAPHYGPQGRSAAVVEDRAWQFHLAVAQSLLACGRRVHAQALDFEHDVRLLVRRAFTRLTAVTGSPGIAELCEVT